MRLQRTRKGRPCHVPSPLPALSDVSRLFSHPKGIHDHVLEGRERSVPGQRLLGLRKKNRQYVKAAHNAHRFCVVKTRRCRKRRGTKMSREWQRGLAKVELYSRTGRNSACLFDLFGGGKGRRCQVIGGDPLVYFSIYRYCRKARDICKNGKSTGADDKGQHDE